MSRKARNRMTKDTVPEGFSVPMALVDLVPVVFFGLSAVRLGSLFHSALFVAGALICLLSGVVKVGWKLIAAVSGKNSAGQTVWGLNEPALAGWNVLPYIWSNGGEITNEDNTKASGYINSEKTIAAVQMLADMAKNGELSGYNSGDIPMTDGFGTGRYIFLLEGPWKTAELAGAYPDMAYGNCQLPAGEAGSISVLGGEDIAMFNGSHKDAAWKFMQFMTSPFAEEEMAKCGQIPVNKTALESETVKNASFAPFLEAITTAKARPAVASWSEIDNELTTAMTKILVNGADVKETLDALAVTIDGLLA